MSKIKITILLTLFVVCGIIPLSAIDFDTNEWSYLSYPVWKTFTQREKNIYLTGYLQGTFIFTVQVEIQFNSKALSEQLRNYLPPYTNHSIVEAIDWIYEMPKYHNTPVYFMIPNIDGLMKERYAYYLQYEKGGQ